MTGLPYRELVGDAVTIDAIRRMNYTQFISFAGQWNIPPGSLSTVTEWKTFGQLTKDSKILEIACTTGFSSRELVRLVGCSAHGVDICPESVAMANHNKRLYVPEVQLTYSCEDANTYFPKERFTHCILGACLGFFDDPEKFLAHMPNFFDPNQDGYILASPYYGTKEMPVELIEMAKDVIGITPTQTDYTEIRSQYSNYETLYEQRKDIIVESESDIEKYTSNTINAVCAMREIRNEEVYSEMYDRLHTIRTVCNDLRKHQAYSVLVLRYRKDHYPNRFIDLF